jgi:glycosyltransferase involved in cell wall biosynthesis
VTETSPTIRVLMVCPELPSATNPGSMAPTARQIESIRKLGIEVDVVDMRGIPKLKYLQILPKVHRLSREVDLIHAHFGYCGWLTRTQWRKPIVMSFMGSDLYGDTLASGRPGWFSSTVAACNRRFLARSVSSIIVKSQHMSDLLSPLPTTIIPNGVDVATFVPIDKLHARQQLNWDPNKRYVLFPGDTQNPRKGFDLATKAVQQARSETQEVVEMVVLWGVSPEQVPLYMNACDVMLMVSHAEGSPNVVKEAMACNLPVIGVPVGDVHEVMADVPGYACCQRESDEIAHHLGHLLKQPPDARGRQAIFAQKLDLPSVAHKVIRVYEQVLQRPLPVQLDAYGESVEHCS